MGLPKTGSGILWVVVSRKVRNNGSPRAGVYPEGEVTVDRVQFEPHRCAVSIDCIKRWSWLQEE